MPAKRPRSSTPSAEPAAPSPDAPKPATKPATKPRAPRAPRASKATPSMPRAEAAAADVDAGDAGDEAESDGEEAAEVEAEVLEPATDALGDVAEPTDDDEVEPADDDEERPRKRQVVAYADDPDSKQAALSHYDPMQAYLREVQRHALLTPDEEHDLATKYFTTGDVPSAHRLVTANLRLVVKIAYEYRRAYKNIMDLVQEGNVGLMQAVKKFDPGRGVKLSSYAAWWIRAYILRFILNNWRMVKLGTTQAQRKLFFNLNKEKQRLLALGIDPTAKAIAERLHVDEKEVADMDVRLGASEASLDAPIGDADGRATARVDMLVSKDDAADVMLAEAELQSALRGKLSTFRETLKGKDLEIFDLRLATHEEPLTLQELGDRFGVSRERVRQLEARLVGRLRTHLRQEIEDAAQS